MHMLEQDFESQARIDFFSEQIVSKLVDSLLENRNKVYKSLCRSLLYRRTSLATRKPQQLTFLKFDISAFAGRVKST